MKCDASLLNQRKPFFMPDWSADLRYIPCQAVRICRLGKCIDTRYANRYYDAIAQGLDFIAWDLKESDYAQATAFDNALCVGEWLPIPSDNAHDIDEAIHRISQVVTLRMGDIVYLDLPEQAQPLQVEQIIQTDHLYCKIK
ncbi:MAG: hypothetical protein MJZ64_02390 [Paludibacteraceae bacterium]|nr:hypothetical protein [Paludibacteraceae bacterium]